MTQEEILQYNKMCAEFLNLHRDKEVAIYNLNAYQYDFLKFHSDWNWIMEVVEAIEKKGYEIDIFSNCVEICDTPDENYITEAVGKTKKEAVVQAINQFLIWYNENNTN
jgi:hypothetical protein